MSLIKCPKCNKIINSVFYPNHWKKERPNCIRCRYHESHNRESKIEVLNDAAAGMAHNKEQWMTYIARVKKHYDDAILFDLEIMIENKDGHIEWKVNIKNE